MYLINIFIKRILKDGFDKVKIYMYVFCKVYLYDDLRIYFFSLNYSKIFFLELFILKKLNISICIVCVYFVNINI